MDPVSSETSYGALRVLLSNRHNHSKRTERSCRGARKLPSPNGSSRRFGSITSGNYCGRGVSRNLRPLEPTGCSEQAWLTASGWRGADINERTCRRTDAPPPHHWGLASPIGDRCIAARAAACQTPSMVGLAIVHRQLFASHDVSHCIELDPPVANPHGRIR
jgi:hypothetical protein